jgi:hypothetical protein
MPPTDFCRELKTQEIAVGEIRAGWRLPIIIDGFMGSAVLWSSLY